MKFRFDFVRAVLTIENLNKKMSLSNFKLISITNL